MNTAKVTKFVHRVSLLAIAGASAVLLVAQNYGVDFGLTAEQIGGIAAGATAFITIARTVSDSVTKAGDVLQEQIAILRDAVEALSSRGEVEFGVGQAVLDRTNALTQKVADSTVPKA